VKKILIVEDDITIAEMVRDFLRIDGFDVTIETDGAEGNKKASLEKFDLILLDIMLSNMNGYDICRNIRGIVDVPIIMVTAKDEESDKIRGLGIGADDYISKPFSPSELVARVKSNLAQYERVRSAVAEKEAVGKKQSTGEIQAGRIKVNLLTHRVYVDGEEIELKNKEYELFTFLLSNPDIVFSKEQLYERIWGMDAFGDLKTVGVHIGRLREKVEKDPQNPDHIQTVWGAGYRFVI